MKQFALLIMSLLITQNVFGEAMSLSQFLKIVQERNLDLKVDEAKADAVNAQAIGLSLPPPEIGFTQVTSGTGERSKNTEVSQTIPFPTKLSNDFNKRKLHAASMQESYWARRSEVLADAKWMYINLWSNEEKLSLLKSKKAILESHIKLSRSAARSDSFASIHVLKAETDQDILENEINAQEQMLINMQTEIALLLNNPANFKFQTVDPPLSAPPEIDSPENTHQLKSLQYELESHKAKESEAKSAWFPEFKLKYKEMGATSSEPRSNEVMLSVSLPFLFFWGPSAENKVARAERMQAELELEKGKRKLEGDKSLLISKIASLKIQLESLQTKLIPRAEKRMKIAHNLSPRDMETIQDHRETMEAFPDLKMKSLELRLEYEKAISDLEKYVSSPGVKNE